MPAGSVTGIPSTSMEMFAGAPSNDYRYSHWMIKFPSSQDVKDIGAIEYAYSLMARAAGVEMKETYLFRTKKGRYFN